MSQSHQKLEALTRNLEAVILGKSETIRLLLVALLADGHVLLEDIPGTGKTTLARALARSIAGEFRRIQFTPDLLPTDITGTSLYRPADGHFEFREGPVFSNVLLADEINRTSPRTQAALLEVMGERQVTVEGTARGLPKPFFLIATENPIDFHGTYPIPEAQLDRFAMRLSIGRPDRDSERQVLYSQAVRHPLDAIEPVITGSEILQLQAAVRQVRVETSVADYLLDLVQTLRDDPRLRLSVSTRGALVHFRCAQALALMEGRDFVRPDDVRLLAEPVLVHRLFVDQQSRLSGVTGLQVLRERIAMVPIPR